MCLIPILAGIAVVGSLAVEGGMDPFSTVLIIVVVSLFANPGVTLLVICMVPVLVVGVLQVFFARKTDTVLKEDPDKAEFYKKASAELRAAGRHRVEMPAGRRHTHKGFPFTTAAKTKSIRAQAQAMERE